MSRKTKAAEIASSDVWDITVTGRNVLVTDAMKNYAISKISKIERFTHRIIEVNVIMDIQKLDHRVDIIAKMDNNRIKSSASSTDMYASVDMAVKKLTEQLIRYKTRISNHHSIGHEDIAMNVNIYEPLPADTNEVNDEIEAENNRLLIDSYQIRPIVNKETRPLWTLTNNEAIIKMTLSGDQFMIFRCEEDRKIKVIYRRNDGNFGVIEPE